MKLESEPRPGITRAQISWRAAQDIPNGAYVNLGIGIPDAISKYIPEGRTVVYHTENGVLGFGALAEGDEGHPDMINAGKKRISAQPGGSFFHQADSFAMIRGGHIDMCFLGAFQVAQSGDLANWSTGASGAVPAVGGAMDLVAGVERIFVLTDHNTRDGAPKLVSKCTYPLTAKKVVERVYTNLAVLDISPDGFVVREMAPGISEGLLRERTDAALVFATDLQEIDVPELS